MIPRGAKRWPKWPKWSKGLIPLILPQVAQGPRLSLGLSLAPWHRDQKNYLSLILTRLCWPLGSAVPYNINFFPLSFRPESFLCKCLIAWLPALNVVTPGLTQNFMLVLLPCVLVLRAFLAAFFALCFLLPRNANNAFGTTVNINWIPLLTNSTSYRFRKTNFLTLFRKAK